MSIMLIIMRKCSEKSALYDLSLLYTHGLSPLNMFLWVPIMYCLKTVKIGCTECESQSTIVSFVFLLISSVSFVQYLVASLAKFLHVKSDNKIYSISVSKNDLRILGCYGSYFRRFALKAVLVYFPLCWILTCSYVTSESESIEQAEKRYKVNREIENETIFDILNEGDELVKPAIELNTASKNPIANASANKV
jgi:hypothetical protein